MCRGAVLVEDARYNFRTNPIVYGQIQGFLLAMNILNSDMAQQTENCCEEFTFYHVPKTGYILTSLVNYIHQRINELSPGREWIGYPQLEPVHKWEEVMLAKLNGMFFFSFQPVAAFDPAVTLEEPSQCASEFLALLKQLFDESDIKVWSLKWSKFDRYASETYPWSVAYHNDYVFECETEIYHLTLIYTD